MSEHAESAVAAPPVTRQHRRGGGVSRHLPWIAVAVLAFAFPLVSPSTFWLFTATQIGIYMLAAIGLNVVGGYAGQLSVAHGALMAVGAYGTGLLIVDGGWSFWAATPVGVLAALVLGLVLAIPALRLSAWYFATVTIILAIVVEDLLVEWVGLTHGFTGVIGTGVTPIGSVTFQADNLYWLVAGLVTVAMLATRQLVGSRFGKGFVAIREGTPIAQACGVSVLRLKIGAFAYSAVLGGLAGALFAGQKGVLTPDDFSVNLSIFLLVVVILGGAGRLWGPVIGALVFFGGPELLDSLEGYRLLVYGALLVLLAVFAPRGLVGLGEAVLARLQRGRPGAAGEAQAPAASAPSPATAAAASSASSASSTRDANAVGDMRVEGVAVEVGALRKVFGGVTALDGVELSVPPGSTHAVVGPNGSGKTTLLNLVSGFYVPTSGTITLSGTSVIGRSPDAIARLGVGRTFQTPRLLPDLSVVDNVMLGAYAHERASWPEVVAALPRARRERAQSERLALDVLRFVGADELARERAGKVPHGYQRLIEIARALMARPRLLLLDEPAAGLSLGELDRLAELVRAIRTTGMTVIVVEHHLDLVTSICDRVTVLDRGRILAEGEAREVFSDARVQAAYMGRAR